MDFSPLHPDVWFETDAGRWHYYLQIRQAFEDARDEVRDKRSRKKSTDNKSEDFYKKHQGASF